jgi:ferric-dicitrate binding protein FerR (iron transport regulator)
MSKSFNRLLAEMRRELGTEEARGVDWDAVDAALFARLDRERRAERARFAPQPRRGMTVSAAVLAAAAAVLAVLAGKTRETASADHAESVESAGTIVAIEGDGRVRVDGTSVASGAGLKLGDVVETSASRATIERWGKLTMTVEPNSRAAVTHVHGALIVALEQGAVEAQVTPVPAGEAFAVDVGNSRVAVHGTRLRVARAGERVTVDLDEGVISVGEAPRVGSLVGTLVNAPAHVEFNAADALGTLTQSHDPDTVHEAKVQSGALGGSKPTLRKPESGADSRPSVTTAPESRAESRSSANALAKQASAFAEPSPAETIANAVRACMAERPHADNVTVVVNTTLRLELGADGSVRTARFDPPVAPDVNGCAVPSIYKTRFGQGGSIAIPIDFTN